MIRFKISVRFSSPRKRERRSKTWIRPNSFEICIQSKVPTKWPNNFIPTLPPSELTFHLLSKLLKIHCRRRRFTMYLKRAYREFLTLKNSIRNDSPFRIGKSAAISCLVCIFLLFGEKRGKRYSVPKLFSRFSRWWENSKKNYYKTEESFIARFSLHITKMIHSNCRN